MYTVERTALVTGAARGIGLATARLLLSRGCRVVAIDRENVDAGFVARENPAARERVRTVTLNVTDGHAITALRTQIESDWGPVGILVNNAGISPKNTLDKSNGILDITPEEWALVLDVNLTAVLRLCQTFLPGMIGQGWGRIVNLSSMAGRTKSVATGGSYMASKAAVLGITRAIAGEMGPHGITANAVAPGRIMTEMAALAGPEVNGRHAESTPVRRLGTVEEVAAAIAYLASEEAGFVNGTVIDINGGFYM